MEESDHPPFWLARGGGGKRKIKEMRMKYFIFLGALWVSVAGLLAEDVIRLKNGEVLKGQAVKFDEGSMT